MNEVITDWLNSTRDYQDGVLLYSKYGKSATLKALFMSGNNSYTRTKLVSELQALSEVKPSRKKAETNTTPVAPTVDKSNWPDVVKQWYNDYVMCLKQMTELHSRLYRATSDKARFKLALAIDELDIKSDVLLADINYFRDNGILPDKDGYNVDDMSATELANARKNIPSYIAKLNTKLKADNLTDERIAELQFRKAEWEKILNQVKEKINAF